MNAEHKRKDPEWRDIPGYGGIYQISRMGEVRSWQRRYRGEKPVAEPRLMTQYVKKSARPNRSRYVMLMDTTGKRRSEKVLTLMANTWLGGPKPGMVPYHKNGDLSDHCVHNIAFATRQELGRMTGAMASRKPVAKISPDGEVMEVYPSASAAAKANYMDYKTMRRRCCGRVKDPFALDGYDYRYER